MEQTPSIGRIVLFTPDEGEPRNMGAAEYAAVIGHVSPSGRVFLLVHPPFAASRWEGPVPEGSGAYTWRWPPRV